MRLEAKPELHGCGAWRHVMRSTKGGKEIIDRVLVCHVDHSKPQIPLVVVAMKDVVVADRQVKQAPWLDSLRIMIIVLRVRRRDFHQSGA